MPDASSSHALESRWQRPAARFFLRFLSLYIGLYALRALALFALSAEWADSALKHFWQGIAVWVGHNVLGITGEIFTGMTGSGDTTVDWITAGCIGVISLVGAAIWLGLDRTPGREPAVAAALRVYVRYALGAVLISYGFAKFIPPVQFSPPSLFRMTEPLHEFSPMGLLWTFMGVSPAYLVFTGIVEVFAGGLLLFRRTTLLGALLSLAVAGHILALNLCYDIPVKLFSAHLVGMSLLLLAPDLRRLVTFFFSSAPTAGAHAWRLPLPPRVARIAPWAKALILLSITWSHVIEPLLSRDGTTPKPELGPNLVGIWLVEEFERVGMPPVSPTATDFLRWRTVTVNPSGVINFRRVDDTRTSWLARPTEAPGRLTLRPIRDKEEFTVTFAREGEHLVIAGRFDGEEIRAKLRAVDQTKFTLTTRGFHWISERPFNR